MSLRKRDVTERLSPESSWLPTHWWLTKHDTQSWRRPAEILRPADRLVLRAGAGNGARRSHPLVDPSVAHDTRVDQRHERLTCGRTEGPCDSHERAISEPVA